MVEISLAIFAILTGGAVLWFLVRNLERSRHRIEVESLEARLGLAHSRAGQLHEQLVRAQTELLQSTRALERERVEKEKILKEFLKPWKRIGLGLAGASLALGALAGAYAGARETALAYEKRMVPLETARAAAEARFQALERRTETLVSDLYELRRRWEAERESRIIAETKLEILTGEKPASGLEREFGFAFKPALPEVREPATAVSPQASSAAPSSNIS